MPKAVDEIAELHAARVKATQEQRRDMSLFREYIADRLPVPLPELDRDEQSAIANLARTGLEQLSFRTGSTLPEVVFPPRKQGIKDSEVKARNRKSATLGWWEKNNMQAALTLRAEYLFADGSAPVTVLPDPKTGVPTWRVRDNMSCLPAPSHDPLSITPRDCIFYMEQTWGALKDVYGPRVANLRRDRNCGSDTKFTVVEYFDQNEIVNLVLPHKNENYDMVGIDMPLLLDRIPNKSECDLVFVPGINSIIGRHGKFMGTIGVHQMRAKLLALAYITTRRGAFPDPWVEPIDNSSTPDFTAVPNHRTGTPGVIKGGRLKYVNADPGFMTSPMLSILEREGRIAAGLPAEFSGEAASSVRTARRGDQLIGSAIDFHIQNAQLTLARSLECEDKAAIAIAKKWTPGKRSFYVSWKGAKGWADYDPNVDFETDEHSVKYPFAGSDFNDATIRHAQKVGTEGMSRRTSMEMDPEIEDAEIELDRIESEKVQALFWESIATKVADPTSRWGPAQIAKLDKLIRTDKKDRYEAVAEIEAEMQETVEAPPDAVPGVAGAPVGELPPAIPEVGQGLANLSSQLRTQFPINAAAGAA